LLQWRDCVMDMMQERDYRQSLSIAV